MKSTSFSGDLRSASARSKVARQRGAPVPNSPSSVQSVDQKPDPKQEESQEPSSLRARLTGCVPKDPNTFVFFLFVVIYLVCATIRFVHTDDAGMLITLLPYAGAYVGIPLVTPHIPWGKKGENNQQN